MQIPTVALLAFRLAQLSMFQPEQGRVFSVMATWNPRFPITSRISVVGDLGGAPLLSEEGRIFPMGQAQMLGSYRNSDLEFGVEAGGGVQWWHGNGGLIYIGSANLGYFPKRPIAKVVESIFAGYTVAFIPSVLTHQVKVGLSFIF